MNSLKLYRPSDALKEDLNKRIREHHKWMDYAQSDATRDMALSLTAVKICDMAAKWVYQNSSLRDHAIGTLAFWGKLL